MTAGWHHFAGVVDNSADEMRLYYDGTIQLSDTLSQTLRNSSEGVQVGGLPTANHFDGRIEEVRISDIPRYSGDSYAVPSLHFNCDANTRALWHFDETAGATLFYDGEDGPGDACGSMEDTLTGRNGAATGP
jgi:hypothetical protein